MIVQIVTILYIIELFILFFFPGESEKVEVKDSEKHRENYLEQVGFSFMFLEVGFESLKSFGHLYSEVSASCSVFQNMSSKFPDRTTLCHTAMPLHCVGKELLSL